MPLLFSSFPARVTLEALPGGVPKRSASRMPVELGRDPFQVSREGPVSCCHHQETLTLVTMTITAAIYRVPPTCHHRAQHLINTILMMGQGLGLPSLDYRGCKGGTER